MEFIQFECVNVVIIPTGVRWSVAPNSSTPVLQICYELISDITG